MKGADKILEGGKRVVSELAEYRDGNTLTNPYCGSQRGWETDDGGYLWRL